MKPELAIELATLIRAVGRFIDKLCENYADELDAMTEEAEAGAAAASRVRKRARR